ncbi:hypothetical protein D1007_48762 [Hordeum vulgare]|nr:hypothetical protein D1007_48762 [Hordeum vulgare]
MAPPPPLRSANALRIDLIRLPHRLVSLSFSRLCFLASHALSLLRFAMTGGSRCTVKSRRARPAQTVAPPPALLPVVEDPLSEPMLAPLRPFPAMRQPWVESATPEARAEMLRVVRERFPDRSSWPGIYIEIIQYADFDERMRFIGDDTAMDYAMLFWAIHEAESADPAQAARWTRFRTRNPSRLNIRPPSMVEIARIPPKYLPPGTMLPRVP